MTRLYSAIVFTVFVALAPLQAQAPREGVSVRGDWVLEVVNPDGSIAERRAFKNAFVGRQVLGRILTGKVIPGRWRVDLFSDQATSPWQDRSFEHLYESDSPAIEGVKTLTVDHGDAVLLRGHVTANKAGAITSVATEIVTCDPILTMAQCRAVLSFQPFSETALSTPLQLQADQMVRVTVTISFTPEPH